MTSRKTIAAIFLLPLAFVVLYRADLSGFFLSGRTKKNLKIFFIDVTKESHMATYCGSDYYAWGDFNSDDYPDIVITRHRIAPLLSVNQKNQLYKNNGRLQFQDICILAVRLLSKTSREELSGGPSC